MKISKFLFFIIIKAKNLLIWGDKSFDLRFSAFLILISRLIACFLKIELNIKFKKFIGKNYNNLIHNIIINTYRVI